MTYPNYFSAYLDKIENALKEALPTNQTALNEAITYAVLNGGKRLRPLIVLLTAEALEVPLSTVMPIAVAVELIHCYSLVHDDLPGMDNDILRRGKPTCHVIYGEGMAILVGDALQTLAFETLAKASLEPQQTIEIMTELTKAIGHHGMAEGQARDILSRGKTLTIEEIILTHQLKTGELLSASVNMPCILGQTHQNNIISSLKDYISALGLAFQIQDDILDVQGTTEKLGKTQGKDNQQLQPTIVSISSLKQAASYVDELHTAALNALIPLDQKAIHFKQLSLFLLNRDY